MPQGHIGVISGDPVTQPCTDHMLPWSNRHAQQHERGVREQAGSCGGAVAQHGTPRPESASSKDYAKSQGLPSPRTLLLEPA